VSELARLIWRDAVSGILFEYIPHWPRHAARVSAAVWVYNNVAMAQRALWDMSKDCNDIRILLLYGFATMHLVPGGYRPSYAELTSFVKTMEKTQCE